MAYWLWVPLIVVTAIAISPSSLAYPPPQACSERDDVLCQAYVAFSPRTDLPISAIASLFKTNLDSLLLANKGCPETIPAAHLLNIPQSCACINGKRRGNSTVYEVKRGDTLSEIASLYGNWVSYQEIAAVNRIPDPDLIFPRQRFLIPFPCACTDSALHNAHFLVSYKVRPHDTLAQIANSYNTTVQELMAMNGLSSDSAATRAGDVVFVPLPAGTTISVSSPQLVQDFHHHDVLLSQRLGE